ncbi:MAG: hypothetical protein KUG81_03140 [Gammaproteobacteria bacterium]|nr:hypothetical protein [Gammaproteobacteria bacterium]
MKLPRKLKKALKKAVLKNIDPAWKSKEVRINRISKTSYPQLVREPKHKGTFVTSYSLG